MQTTQLRNHQMKKWFKLNGNYSLVVSMIFFQNLPSLSSLTGTTEGKQKQLFPPKPVLAKLSLFQRTFQGCKLETTKLSLHTHKAIGR
jgi:hypothetical protein